MRRYMTPLSIGVFICCVFARSGDAACTPLGSTTPYLGLCKPSQGETGWTSAINGNWEILDGKFLSGVVLSPTFGGTGLNAPGASGHLLTSNGTAWVSAAPALLSPLTTKGDLYAYSTTNGRFPVGANGQHLVADSTQSFGLKYVSPNSYQASPSNPTGTTSTSGVMMGLAGSITPSTSGVVSIQLSGTITTAAGSGSKVRLRYGTGSVPTNGAALAGSTVSGLVTVYGAGSAVSVPFAVQGIVSGLSAGTAYWIDAEVVSISGGLASITDLSLSAMEW